MLIFAMRVINLLILISTLYDIGKKIFQLFNALAFQKFPKVMEWETGDINKIAIDILGNSDNVFLTFAITKSETSNFWASPSKVKLHSKLSKSLKVKVKLNEMQ